MNKNDFTLHIYIIHAHKVTLISRNKKKPVMYIRHLSQCHKLQFQYVLLVSSVVNTTDLTEVTTSHDS